MDKKAAIEIQFNWIFVLIIGVVILGFFVSIINKQKTIAEEQISTSIKVNLGAVLTGARAATSTASRINIPDIDIIYDCDGYIVGKANAIRSKTSFSPNLIKGPVIMSWTHEWRMPYRVNNFMYITSPFVRYIFVNDPAGLASQVYSALPNRTIVDQGDVKAFFTKELVNANELSSITDENHYKVRVIFFGDSANPESVELPSLGGVKSRDFTALQIKANSFQDLDETGELVFFTERGDSFSETGRSVYVGEASAFGAIFADEAETYECNMQMAFNTLEIVNAIYWGRVKQMKTHYQSTSDPNNCQVPYTQADSYFNSIDQATRDFNTASANSLFSASNGIMQQNEESLRRSCPAIY